MKLKLLIACIIGALAFAGVAQAAGLFAHEDNRMDQLQQRSTQLAQGLRQPSAGISARRGPRGPKGARGARGPVGPQGPAGAQGAFGGLLSVDSPPAFLCSFEAGPCAVGSARAECPPGTAVVGGGYLGAGIVTTVTYDARSGNGWGIVAVNLDEVPVSGLRAEAICAS